MIDMVKLNAFTDEFNSAREEHLLGLEGTERMKAAALYDKDRPKTSQRQQLISIGVNAKDLEHNLQEVILGLDLMGVKVLRKGVPNERVIDVLDKALDDIVPSMWKCDGYFEVIDADPRGEFLSRGDRELKRIAFSGLVEITPDLVQVFI
jgi:hypothetical protein